MTERHVYEFYNQTLKPLFMEIEAKGNTLPVEALFEIHAAFDHLKRYHLNECAENICCEKALSHLKRGALDIFKLKLKHFNDTYSAMIATLRNELQIIDNGNFLPSLIKKRESLIITAKQARLDEGQSDVAVAFEKWCDASLIIDEIESVYFDTMNEKIEWAKGTVKRKRLKSLFREQGLGFLIGIVSGVVATIVYSLIFG